MDLDTFNFAFTLIGLVLGLCLAEVLAGFAGVIKARRAGRRDRVGWLTPLLGIVVIADIGTFWGMIWQVRASIPNLYQALGAGVALTAIYYVAATSVFPERGDDSTDLDAHFWANRRFVLGLILVCNFATMALTLMLGDRWPPTVIAVNLLFLALAGFTAFARGRRATIAGLIALLVDYVWIFSDWLPL